MSQQRGTGEMGGRRRVAEEKAQGREAEQAVRVRARDSEPTPDIIPLPSPQLSNNTATIVIIIMIMLLNWVRFWVWSVGRWAGRKVGQAGGRVSRWAGGQVGRWVGWWEGQGEQTNECQCFNSMPRVNSWRARPWRKHASRQTSGQAGSMAGQDISTAHPTQTTT